MDTVVFIMALCACLLLASCSYVDEPSQPKSVGLLKIPNQSKIKITDIYQKFTPSLAQLQSLQNRHISRVQYGKYLTLLKLKSTQLYAKFQNTFLHSPKLIYKYSIPERKHDYKKEWTWGNRKLTKAYYKSFNSPVYEHKIAYQVMPSPKAKTVTNSLLVFYFYKKRGTNQIYLIDPDIYRQSILSK